MALKSRPRGFRRSEDLRIKVLKKTVSLKSFEANRQFNTNSKFEDPMEIIRVLKSKQQRRTSKTVVPKSTVIASQDTSALSQKLLYCKAVATKIMKRFRIESMRIVPKSDKKEMSTGIKSGRRGKCFYI